MPTARYFSIVYNVANASGIVFSIEDAFKGANCKDFDKLVGMNIDDASMNLGTHKGMSMFLKEKGPQIQWSTVFDHHVELALEGAFKTPSFK